VSTPNEPETLQEAGPQQPQPQQPQPPQPPQPSPAAQPAPPAVDRSTLPPYNVMAIIAFAGSFLIPVVGIVCGHITLAEYRKGLPERGREYAQAGMILGYVFTAVWIVLAIIWIVFAFTHFGHTAVVGTGGRGGNGFGGGQGGFGGGRNLPFSTPRATPNGN
jgi:uncharacterized membrane protein YgcG